MEYSVVPLKLTYKMMNVSGRYIPMNIILETFVYQNLVGFFSKNKSQLRCITIICLNNTTISVHIFRSLKIIFLSRKIFLRFQYFQYSLFSLLMNTTPYFHHSHYIISYFFHYSQIIFFIPYRIQFLLDGFCSSFRLSYLHSHIRITGSSLIFSDQTLGTYYYKNNSIRLVKVF